MCFNPVGFFCLLDFGLSPGFSFPKQQRSFFFTIIPTFFSLSSRVLCVVFFFQSVVPRSLKELSPRSPFFFTILDGLFPELAAGPVIPNVRFSAPSIPIFFTPLVPDLPTLFPQLYPTPPIIQLV